MVARCFYEAYVQDDRDEAGRFAASAAVTSMFSTPFDGDPWDFTGCGDASEYCTFAMPGEIHGGVAEMAMTINSDGGPQVSAVNFYG
jgi:hypothetical protein